MNRENIESFFNNITDAYASGTIKRKTLQFVLRDLLDELQYLTREDLAEEEMNELEGLFEKVQEMALAVS